MNTNVAFRLNVIPFFYSVVMSVTACDWIPSIDKVEKETRESVEELLTEDNNQDAFFRLDRYFLDEQLDLRTYTGSMKATYFYKNEHGKWNSRRGGWVATQDSLKVYWSVTIKYRGWKFDAYTISIRPRDD